MSLQTGTGDKCLTRIVAAALVHHLEEENSCFLCVLREDVLPSVASVVITTQRRPLELIYSAHALQNKPLHKRKQAGTEGGANKST